MTATFLHVASLLAAMAIMLLGTGLGGTLVGVRAGIEGFPDRVVGLIGAAYFLGFAAGAWACPRLVRRVGNIRAFAVLAALACSCILACGLLVHPWAWLPLRALAGLAQMGLFLCVESWLNAETPADRRGRIFGLYQTCNLLALAGAQALLTVHGAAGMSGFALAALCAALAVVPIALTRLVEPRPLEVPTLNLAALARDAPLGVVAAAATGLANGAFWTLGPLFAHRLGLAEGAIAAFLASVIVGGALLQVPIGRLSDRYDRRAVLGGIGLAAGAAAATAAAVAGHTALPWLLLAMACYGGTSMAVYATALAHTNDRVDVRHTLESTRGLLLLHGLGAVAGPILAGLAMQALGPRALPAWLGLVYGGLGVAALLCRRLVR